MTLQADNTLDSASPAERFPIRLAALVADLAAGEPIPGARWDENRPAKGLAIIPTYAVPIREPPKLRTFVLNALQDADIRASSSVMRLITSILFEAAANAEEHGRVQVGSSQGELRFIGLIHHYSDKTWKRGPAAEYAAAYGSMFRPPEKGWLEIVVGDTGMGVSYPGFYVLGGMGTGEPNIYEQPFAVEQMWLQKALARGFSTKGQWGQIVTSQSQPGKGTQQLGLLAARANAFACVRTGRALATATLLGPEAAPREDQATFTVSSEEKPLLMGTVWNLVVPLTSQLELFDS